MTNIQNKIDQRPIAEDASVGLMPKVLKNKINFSNETINEIIAFVNTGELDQAEQLALDLTASHPKKGIGWKILGTIYQKQAKNEQSVHALKNALKTLPQDFEVHFNYANAHFDLKNYDIAKRHYQAALKISPNFISAHFNLGSLYQEQKELSLAIKHFVKVTQLNNSHVEAYLKLASIYSSQKQPELSIAELLRVAALGVANAAIYTSLAIEFSTIGKSDQSKEYFEKALLIEPENALSAHIDYAVFLKSAGKLDEAISVINHALNNDLEDFDLYNTLGLIYLQQEKLADAEYCFKKTILLNPKNELGYINYGLMKLNQGQLVDAEAYCMKGLELCPDNKVALNNLALIFNHQGRYDDAISTFEKVIAIDDTYITALSNISTPLRRFGRFSEAEAYLQKAFTIDSTNYELHVNLASIYQGMGLIDKAIEYNWKAIEMNPDKLISYENLLFDTSYTKAYDLEYVKDKLDLYGETLTRVAKHQFNNWYSNPDTKCLKVGFVSADFIIHPVSTFLKNVLENLNLNHFELVAFSNNKFEDGMTQTLKTYFKAWHCIVGMSDSEVAQLIHDDAIDILIDLSGHTGGNRLGIFAYKPAPVQVTWLGYWASTGVAQMDYILLDEVSAPLTFKNQFTEKIKYLPETRFCYSPPSFDVPLTPLPALQNHYITFGCYHTYAKVSDEALAVWAKVMAKLPKSILRWQTAAFKDEKLINQVHQKMQKYNISSERILLSASKPYKEYFNTYDQVDFVLDSFPFTACTTTSDALWMGVPTLTIAGNRLVERQGASLMNAVGLPEWIANDEDEFIEKAVFFAGNVQYLSETRETLRDKLLNSTLGDGKKFAQNFEQALWEIWQGEIWQGEIWQEKKPQNTQVSELENTKKTQHSFVISSATRMSEQAFWETSALGLSIKSQMQLSANLKVNVAFNNTLGLSEVYNAQINQAEEDAILVFMHDDVWIDQRDLLEAVEAGLEKFDVIGVAGNKRILPNQPAWAFIDTNFTWDKKEHLSGKIGHGKSAYGEISNFGPVPAKCELLDGVFLAVKKQTLLEKNVYFDPQFDFHFYDLDFCRTASAAGLTLGTWDIALTHQSGGAFGSERWQQKHQLYLNKWEQPALEGIAGETAQDPEAIYQLALQYQQNGHDVEAEQLYQQVLQMNSEHADAIHNLGYIEFAKQGAEAALIRFESAVMLQPQSEQFWVSYIDALVISGAIETAANAIELGQHHGLSAETAKILAEEIVQGIESSQISYPQKKCEPVTNDTLGQLLSSVLETNIKDIQQAKSQSKSISPDLNLSAFESMISELSQSGRYNEILEVIFKSVLSIKLRPELIGNKIFTPYFDAVLESVNLNIDQIIPKSKKSANVIVASEIYESGGHTKVIAELLETLENPILVITDIYERFAQSDIFAKIASTLPSCPVVILPKERFLDKAIRLAGLINTCAKNVFLVSHHDDSVAVAACQKNFETRYYFVHHADHNPSLGSYVNHFHHVDLFVDIASLCKNDLNREVSVLPIHAQDFGGKVFHYPVKKFSTVSAGTSSKFDFAGAINFAELIATSIKTCGGKHYHFGAISDEHINFIRTHLEQASIAPESFVYMGNVPSLWNSLLEIDAHIYLGSFPKRGGKGEIEAQGASYPILIYKNPNDPRYLNVANCNPFTQNWHVQSEFCEALSRIMLDHEKYAFESRRYYLAKHSKSEYLEALNSLIQ